MTTIPADEVARIVRRLKNITLFASLPDEPLMSLAIKVETREYEKDAALVHTGDAGDQFFIIRSGWAKIVIEGIGGEEITVNHIGPGQAVGDVSLIDGQPYQVSVIAAMPVKVLVLQREDFLKWIHEHPDLGFEMMQGLSAKIRLTSQYVQKAIDWSSKIADGDYSRPMDQIYVEHTMVTTRGHPDEAMVGEFLASFQKMIMKVKTREDELKQQVKELTIRVDSTKVDEEVDELTRSSFFQNLRSAAQRVRRQRSD